METEETQALPAEETTEETTETTEPTAVEKKEGETQEDYRARLNAQNRFLEKEGYKFEGGKWSKENKAPSQEQPFSPKDYLALTEYKISAEDFDEVSDFAKYKNVSVAEALKMGTLKTILTERAEERRTAQATATKGSARGQTKPNDDDLLRRASNGESMGEDAIAQIAKARQNKRLGK